MGSKEGRVYANVTLPRRDREVVFHRPSAQVRHFKFSKNTTNMLNTKQKTKHACPIGEMLVNGKLYRMDGKQATDTSREKEELT